MDQVYSWAEHVWSSSQPVFGWFRGPFWTFLNAPFIAGLIPALVGLLLSKRVAEVAENSKNAEAVRSAEFQVHELAREQDAHELRTAVEDVGAPQAAASSSEPQQNLPSSAASGLPETVVGELEEKIDTIKTEIRHRVAELDGRKRKKYENVPRYDYRPIALMLARDGAMTDEDAYRLVEIFSVWMNYRLNKPMLPQEKADLILGFRLPRRHRRANAATNNSSSDENPIGSPPESGISRAAEPA
jgi:hypothetical protein